MALPEGLLGECRRVASELGDDCPLVFLELLYRLEAGQASVGPPLAEDRRINGPRVLALPRGQGKTTQALAWLGAGHRIGGHPRWSRVLVVPSAERYAHILRMGHPTLSAVRPFDLDRVVVTLEMSRIALRGISGEVLVGIEDADCVLFNELGYMPDVVMMTGVAVDRLPGRGAPSGPVRLLT